MTEPSRVVAETPATIGWLVTATPAGDFTYTRSIADCPDRRLAETDAGSTVKPVGTRTSAVTVAVEHDQLPTSTAYGTCCCGIAHVPHDDHA